MLLVRQPLQASQLQPEIAERAQHILEQRCFACHGANGTAPMNIFVLDRTRLVAMRVVVAGDDNSPLLRKVETGAMPMGRPKLSDEERATLRDWILAGAPDWEHTTSEPKPFISEPELLALIRSDLEGRPAVERQYLRYFSLAHLANAGTPEDALGRYRIALAKLVNSLSWNRKITVPQPIDPAGVLLRIDLRDYDWTPGMWRTILDVYPYGVLRPEGKPIEGFSGEAVPYVRADWFVASASVPPLYYALLGFPETTAQLEPLAGVDTTRDLATEKKVMRAGVRNSGVSRNNRVLERHTTRYGAYWQSY